MHLFHNWSGWEEIYKDKTLGFSRFCLKCPKKQFRTLGQLRR